MKGTCVYDPTGIVDDEGKRQEYKCPNARGRTEREIGKKRHENGKLCEVGGAALATIWPEGVVLFQTGGSNVHSFNDSCDSGKTCSPPRPHRAAVATKPASSVVWGLHRLARAKTTPVALIGTGTRRFTGVGRECPMTGYGYSFGLDCVRWEACTAD